MRPWLAFIVCGAMLASSLSCSVNILQTFGNTTSNKALYEDAQIAINKGDYTGALDKISKMTGAFPSTAAVLELKASAYGGLCGFNFLNFVTAFQGIGTQNLFKFLLANFNAASATYIDNCILAQSTIQSIGAVGVRTTDQNLFLALIEMGKIGNILSYYADPTHTGSATAGFNPCTVGGSRSLGGSITDSDAREIGVGISIAAENLNAISGSVSLGSGSLTSINSLCSALPAAYNFCSVTDPTALTASEVKGVLSLIKESTVIGLGANCTGDVSVCFCP